MTDVHWFSQVFGYLTIALLSLAFLALAAERVLAAAARLVGRAADEAARNARRDLGRLLLSQCHWFGESDDAWLAVEELGRDVVARGDFDVAEVRERWRKRRAGAPAASPDRVTGVGDG